jgi:hypothetical protein
MVTATASATTAAATTAVAATAATAAKAPSFPLGKRRKPRRRHRGRWRSMRCFLSRRRISRPPAASGGSRTKLTRIGRRRTASTVLLTALTITASPTHQLPLKPEASVLPLLPYSPTSPSLLFFIIVVCLLLRTCHWCCAGVAMPCEEEYTSGGAVMKSNGHELSRRPTSTTLCTRQLLT